MEVNSRADGRKATWTLIRSQQKQVMDLPAQFLDPLFENWLTRLLCETPVTPNMVSLACLVAAVAVGWLFWHGYFVAGAFCTFVVEILDGVDGKLARTKLQLTRLGENEHIIDYLYENSWYVALAMGFRARVMGNLPAVLAGGLIFFDTADNLFYTLAEKWYGKSIDLFSSFDKVFRRIAGRRNIYGIMFFLGFLFGYPLHTFAAVTVWAAITASIHGLRLIQYGKSLKKELSQKIRDTR
jgi:phosphatidylglycerophosphate synthase